MNIFFLLTSLVLFLSSAVAQNGGKISGTILQNTKPAEGATVGLLRAKDSTTIKFSVVNKEGVYAFENIAEGKYLINATAVGNQKSFSKVFEVNSSNQVIQVPEMRLIQDA